MEEKGRILIVEDEAVTALDISDILEDLGHTVVGHEVSGQAAINTAREQKPDLILMDIKIKGDMDGITAAGHIHDELKCPVIFLTAFSDEETLARAKILQPYGYVLKPFVQEDLMTTVELALYRIRGSGADNKNSQILDNINDKIEEIEFGSTTLCPYSFLKRVAPFSTLEESNLKNFSDLCNFRPISAGNAIMNEGDEHSEGFIVATGRIALVKASTTGKELTVDLLPPGDQYALLLAHEGEESGYTARAQIDSVILHIPRDPLSKLLGEFPYMYKEFTELLTERVRRSHEFSQLLAHERVELRVARTIEWMLTDFARLKGDQHVYSIKMTRQQLAELTGTTPETAIRVTKKMEREGILSLVKPGYILITDLPALEELAGT